MNILFFLTPKKDVSFIYDDNTLRQALEKLERSHLTAIPMINRTGEYVGTLNEGDLLWYIKNHSDLTLSNAEDVPITAVPRRSDNEPVFAYNSIDDLYTKALSQNFVPVVDGRGVFIGIVARREIFKYLYKVCQTAEQPPEKRQQQQLQRMQLALQHS